MLNYFRSRDRGWILSLFAAVCLLYLPFLGSPFFFDDMTFFFVVSQNSMRTRVPFYAALVAICQLGLDGDVVQQCGDAFLPLGQPAAACGQCHPAVLSAAAIDWRCHSPISRIRPPFVWGAWFGALIFAIHPVAVYAVGYVVQRSILMATFFALLMQLAYLRGLLSGQVRWLVLAAVAYFLAVFSKEHSVMVLALLAAQTVLLRSQVRASARALWLAWAAFFCHWVVDHFARQGRVRHAL